MKYIDADKLIAEIERRSEKYDPDYTNAGSELKELLSFIPSLQQEQPEADLDKLVNEEFASHSRTTEYGLEVTYNRAELYQLIKRMAFQLTEMDLCFVLFTMTSKN